MIREGENRRFCLTVLLLLVVAVMSASPAKAVPPLVQCDAGNCIFPGMKNGAILLLADKDYYPALAGAIGCAKREIIMAFYLFSSTERPGNLPSMMIEALTAAAKRGVAVTVILEREDEPASSLNRDNRVTAARLKRGGVEVYFDSPRQRTHTKTAVIDGRYMFIGSHNLTNSALKYNHELSVVIDSPDMAKETLDYMKSLYR